jgi:hypothetical protein
MVRIFRLMLVITHINSTNIPPIMIINRIHETQKSSVAVACFLPGQAKDLSAPLYNTYLTCSNISFDASLDTYIKSTNILPFMIINRIHETQNLLSL